MLELNGFIKIHRKLIQWGWYQDNVVKGVFLHLLLTARFCDGVWLGQNIKAGEVVVGTQQMAKDLGFTRQQIRTALNKLKSTNEITIKTTNKYSVVTLVNWADYQTLDETPTNKITNTSTNEQPTSNQQVTNKQPQRKNDKNDKKVKNIKNYIDFNSLISTHSENTELQKAIIEFIEMRKSIKKPLATERALLGILNKLKPYDELIQITMLDNSIMNSWQGVFPLSDKAIPKPSAFNNFEERGTETDFDEHEINKLKERLGKK